MRHSRIAAVCGALTLLTVAGSGATDANTAGRRVYQRYCVSCHGDRGDGAGYSAAHLDPRPRNFTGGTFKWRSTASGQLPRDVDVLRTVEKGLYGTAMPGWDALAPTERRDVVAYIKTFSARFAKEKPGEPLPVPKEPPSNSAALSAGAEIYERMQCAQCHGQGGRGDGAASATQRDDWGQPIRVYDLTSGRLKCGDAPTDIYRVFMTGLNGTPMPSFADSLSPDEAWQLVHYILSLRRTK